MSVGAWRRRGKGAALLFVLGSLPLLAPSQARADTPAACTDAYERGQLLRKQGKLLASRDQLRLCASSQCPGLIVSDCNQWQGEVAESIPSVVPLAEDEVGANLLDVKLSIDGAPVSAPPGQAIEVDPGAHTFTFERGDGVKVEKKVLIAIGEKNKRIVATLATVPQAASPASPEAPAPRATSSSSALGVAGLVVGAVGLAGIVVASVFGAEAIAKQKGSGCTSNNVCGVGTDPGELKTAGSDGDVSTSLFVAGGALFAGGVTTWLLAPSRKQTAWVGVHPVAVERGGGLELGGGW